MMKTFKAGDKVIHNSYGLCKIRAIESCDTYYGTQDCYVIYIEKTKIMVPVSHADALRYPIEKEDARRVTATIETIEGLEELPDYITSAEAVDLCSKKNATNNVFGTAGFLRDLTFLNEKNPFRGSARDLLESMKTILADEISIVKKVDKREAQKLIDRSLSKVRERARCSRKK